jgi:hypothetical protein
MSLFTKTGSGQNTGKTQKEMRVLQMLADLPSGELRPDFVLPSIASLTLSN